MAVFHVAWRAALTSMMRTARSIAPRPAGEEARGARGGRRGLSRGIGGEVGVQLAGGGATKLGSGGEPRIGFAFNRQLQLYLAGALTNASYDVVSQQFILASAHLH